MLFSDLVECPAGTGGEAMNENEEKRFKKWQRKVGFRFIAMPRQLDLVRRLFRIANCNFPVKRLKKGGNMSRVTHGEER